MLTEHFPGNPTMTDAIRPLIAGNWKMNGLKASTAEFEAMLAGAPGVAARADLLVCPPTTLIAAFAEKARGSKVAVGAQDCHPKPSGAHTGDLSAEMFGDAGAGAIIVGHSERRADHGESDVLVRQKAEAVWRAGLTAIVCIGETQQQRDAGQTLDICRGQLNVSLPDQARADNLVVAYEPVWAIGTGDPDRRRCRANSWVYPGSSGCAVWRRRGENPHPLRRFGEAFECRGIDGGCERQRRFGRGRQPESG
jgi:Triosephosphate isomerase